MYKRRAINAAKTKPQMDKLYGTLSDEDKHLIGDDEHRKEWLTVEEGEFVVKRFISKDKDVPVSAIDIMTTTREGHLTVAIMTDPKYRGKGYAYKTAKKGVEWYDKNKDRIGATSLSWGSI